MKWYKKYKTIEEIDAWVKQGLKEYGDHLFSSQFPRQYDSIKESRDLMRQEFNKFRKEDKCQDQ